MTHRLALRFDPSFDYLHLLPRERVDGSVDHRNMGYVHNVRRGEVLAEWSDGDGDGPALDLAQRVLPAGRGVREDPEHRPPAGRGGRLSLPAESRSW
jgi:hypothetical protein